MKDRISAKVTFLTPEEGGRDSPTYNSRKYRPHIVMGDPEQRTAILDDSGVGAEDYVGVWFDGDVESLEPGSEYEVDMELLFVRRSDCPDISSGSTFSIREGAKVVGYCQTIR